MIIECLMKNKSKTILKIILTALIVILCLYWALRDIDFELLWKSIVNANYWWALAPIPVMLASHWMRALRWKTMLKPITKSGPVWQLFEAVMIGYAVNNVIPRGGEFLRPYIFSRRAKVSFSSSFATIVVERFIDVLVLLMMFGGVSFFFREQIAMALPDMHVEKLLYPVIALIIFIMLCFYPPFVDFLLKNIVKRISEKLYDRASGIFAKFVTGLAIIKHPSLYFRLILESLGIWLLYTVPMWLMFYSFNFDTRFGMDFSDAILLTVLSGIAFSISPTPGAIGVFHVVVQNALVSIYGVDPAEGLAYATINHGINYFVQVIPGGIFFFMENIKSVPKSEQDVIQDAELIR